MALVRERERQRWLRKVASSDAVAVVMRLGRETF